MNTDFAACFLFFSLNLVDKNISTKLSESVTQHGDDDDDCHHHYHHYYFDELQTLSSQEI